MGIPGLTVKVTKISRNATLPDIMSFFSYCGNIDDIQLQRDDDQTQLAYVTFKQPYAFQTALLLNDATILGSRVCISPLENSGDVSAKSPSLDNKNNEAQNGKGCFVPAACPAMHKIVLKGQDTLNKARELDEKYKVSEKGRAVTEPVISAAEQVASHVGSAILNSTCFSKSAIWLSDVLDKASKQAAELGNYKNKNTNTRKQK